MLQREVAYRDTVNATKGQFQGRSLFEITPRPLVPRGREHLTFKFYNGQGLVSSSMEGSKKIAQSEPRKKRTNLWEGLCAVQQIIFFGTPCCQWQIPWTQLSQLSRICTRVILALRIRHRGDSPCRGSRGGMPSRCKRNVPHGICAAGQKEWEQVVNTSDRRRVAAW
ncbi:hypothetical protein BGY98DRAFT_1019220 [Russula aff. rugulosa BPL654]|nr:hypothetical protein BGY98DRAFT_1019220 [Russula aff. rugulosa BPL654]